MNAVALRYGLLAAALALATCVARHPAQALDIRCIEASRYEFLFQIFGGDAGRFAQYLELDTARPPTPGLCRALLVTGRFEPFRRDNPDDDPDFDRLFRAIADNRGWLAAIYLSSPGGTVGTAMRLAVLTRLFWLKTYAPGGPFLYVPDFLASPDPSAASAEPVGLPAANVPRALAFGWQNYRQAVEGFSRVDLPNGRRAWCASACTYPLVAGIDRHGTPYVHRPRRAATSRGDDSGPHDPSPVEIDELLQRSARRVIALYRHMDAGDEIVRLYQSTPTAALSPAPMARSPRFVADHMAQVCPTEVAAPGVGRESAVAPCVAAAHEKARLRHYATLCGDACDRAAILRAVRQTLTDIARDARQAPPTSP